MKRNVHALLIASLVQVAPLGCLRRPGTAPAAAPSEAAAPASSSTANGVRVVDIQAILAKHF